MTRQRLTIVRATSVEPLAARLAHRLDTAPPGDPLAPVEIAVASHGMERWLRQRLAVEVGARDDEAGICANVAFHFPMAVLRRVLDAVLGDEADDDPWQPERLQWPLVELLDALPDDEVYAPLATHLAGAHETGRRRLPLARRIADLFDRYALHRPDMVAGWARGEDRDARGDTLPSRLAWQPALWRDLRARVAAPSPDVRFSDAVTTLDDQRVARPDALPRTLDVFGVHALPALQLRLLGALSSQIEVTLHVLAPVTAWPGTDDPPAPTNPLLAAWGTAARDAQATLRSVGAEVVTVDEASGAGGGPRSGSTAAATGPTRPALVVLQDDVHADRLRRAATGAPPTKLQPGDRSVQVHACHGMTRQLEVLREALLGLFEDDHTLQPRDVLIVTPDIAAHAPLVRAVFADGEPSDEAATGTTRSGPRASVSGVPRLPVAIADRTVADDNAVAQALAATLAMADDRVTGSRVLDLLARDPVRRRFGLSPADLARVASWVHDTGISWGIDGADRRDHLGLDDPAHTWRAGLDRLALGAAMRDDGGRMVGGVVPFDDIEGRAVDLLGTVLTVTDQLFDTLRRLQPPRSVEAWHDTLTGVIDTLFDPGAGPRRDSELTAQLAAVRQALSDLVDDARRDDGSLSSVALTLDEIRTLVTARLDRPRGPTSTGTGAITVAGPVPLRNVPFRVVCLVGMDDGVFPRAGSHHGFDLLAAAPQRGDPDPRVEDRQLLLDALLSAGDHLVITYTGNDPRTNEARQPAVPLSELLDVLDDSLRTADDSPATARLVVTHPLQPHDPRYFDASDGTPVVPRAFDRRRLAAARAAAGPRTPPTVFLRGPLPPVAHDDADAVVELEELRRFLDHPIRYLLRRRVGIVLTDDTTIVDDRDPTRLDGLTRWQLGDELVTELLAGGSAERWQRLAIARGRLPTGGLGAAALAEVTSRAGSIVDEIRQVPGTARTVPVTVPLETTDGAEPIQLVGSVHLVGDTVLEVTPGAAGARHLLRAWLRLLAVTATGARDVDALVLGRADSSDGVRRTPLAPVVQLGDGDEEPVTHARRLLAELAGVHRRGLVEPIVVLPQAGLAYAKARLEGKEPGAALVVASRAFNEEVRPYGRRGDADVRQAFGDDVTLEVLAAAGSFAHDAETVWSPVAHAVAAGAARRPAS